MEITKKVEGFIKDLIVSLQAAKLYSTAHKKFEESVDKAYNDLREVLEERITLVIGIVGNDFAFENEVFFELSATTFAQVVTDLFKVKGVEKIIFNSLISRYELRTFIAHLSDIQEKEVKLDTEQLVFLNIENIMVDQITSPVSEYEAKKIKEEATFTFYENYLKKIIEYLEAVLNNQEIDYLALKLNIISIMDNLLNMQRFLRLAPLKMPSLNPIVHTVNVSVLTMYLALRLGFTKDEILEMTIASLFHDIGRINIARKKNGTTDARTHSESGAAILLKYVQTLGPLPILVSFEHHLRYDLKGYPRLAFRYKPHVASSIVSICDVYDALSQRRRPGYDYPPDSIYSLMMKEKGKAFNPDLLDSFFRVMGIWPIGTIVLLNDGRVAAVCTENESDISRPKVKITDYLVSKVIDLKNEEALKIEKALNPHTEGKDYLDLI